MPARRARPAFGSHAYVRSLLATAALRNSCHAVSAATAGISPSLPIGHKRPSQRTLICASEAHRCRMAGKRNGLLNALEPFSYAGCKYMTSPWQMTSTHARILSLCQAISTNARVLSPRQTISTHARIMSPGKTL